MWGAARSTLLQKLLWLLAHASVLLGRPPAQRGGGEAAVELARVEARAPLDALIAREGPAEAVARGPERRVEAPRRRVLRVRRVARLEARGPAPRERASLRWPPQTSEPKIEEVD